MKLALKILLASLGISVVGFAAYTYEPSASQAANFTQEYIAASKGRIQFEIPEVYELVNICVLLGGYGENEHQTRVGSTPYAQEVLAYFGKFKSHPCVQRFAAEIKTINNNYAVREPSYSYSFAENGSILQTGPYRGLVPYQQKLLPSLIGDLEQFAEDSDYRRFYAEHREFYDRQKKVFEKLADVDSMWKWLEKRFPQRVNSYRIICSPLTGGNHRTAHGQQNDFTEILMFVSAPIDKKSFTRLEQTNLMRMVFTEIDHNYVNPTTKKVGRAEQAMGQWQQWGGGQTSYRGAEMVFNEYMTFGLFALFSHDRFVGQDAKVGMPDVISLMERRGFTKYGAFQQELLRYYQTEPAATGEGLTAHMMDWCQAQTNR
jgi:hypothetical protein